ncbi:AAA family ATPase [Marinobacteraceae bacterium S3BR75-40.1]
MYEAFFGLREMPFSLTPNTRYFLRADSHRDALETLVVALKHQEGFIKVTGEVGTGKTLLCRLLLNALESEAVTAYLPNPQLSPDSLYLALADELGVTIEDSAHTHRTLGALQAHLIEQARQERSVILIVDEAQSIPAETLEALRLLTNLETESRKLLQVVLFGQPELDTLLNQDNLRQLKQRITFHCRLKPLDRNAVAHYLQHRMSLAGHDGAPVFHPRAVKHLARSSGGIPRLINILAHKSLLAAYGRGDHEVKPVHVKQAVKDTESARRSGWFGWGARA